MKSFKKISVGIVTLLLFTSMSIPAFAAQVTTSTTRPFTYHDAVITPLVIGEIDSTFTWTYDNKANKLVDHKNISHLTRNIAVSCFFNNVNQYWAWYDTKDVKGTAEGVVSWTFNSGIPTPWGTVGTSADNHMIANVTWN